MQNMIISQHYYTFFSNKPVMVLTQKKGGDSSSFFNVYKRMSAPYSWMRLCVKCQSGVNLTNLVPGFFLSLFQSMKDVVSYNSAWGQLFISPPSFIFKWLVLPRIKRGAIHTSNPSPRVVKIDQI